MTEWGCGPRADLHNGAPDGRTCSGVWQRRKECRQAGHTLTHARVPTRQEKERARTHTFSLDRQPDQRESALPPHDSWTLVCVIFIPTLRHLLVLFKGAAYLQFITHK